MSAAELTANSKRARDILSRIHDTYKLAKGRLAKGETRVHALRDLIDDPLIFVQLAKMWQHENVEKAIEAYQTAIEIHGRVKGNKGESVIDLEAHTRDLSGLQMSNNLGALYLGQKNVDEAMQMFEQMLEDLGEVTNEEEKTLQTVLLYNLGRAYEEAKENVKADEVFTGLLARHPEHLPGEQSSVICCSISYLTLCLHADRSQTAKSHLDPHCRQLQRAGEPLEGSQRILQQGSVTSSANHTSSHLAREMERRFRLCISDEAGEPGRCACPVRFGRVSLPLRSRIKSYRNRASSRLCAIGRSV
jgi:tetratricopeptide (TPR) repeat protein